MSCACEHKRLGQQIDRIRRLAKAWAESEDMTVVIYKNYDDTYGFAPITTEIDKPIIEYITPY